MGGLHEFHLILTGEEWSTRTAETIRKKGEKEKRQKAGRKTTGFTVVWGNGGKDG